MLWRYNRDVMQKVLLFGLVVLAAFLPLAVMPLGTFLLDPNVSTPRRHAKVQPWTESFSCFAVLKTRTGPTISSMRT